MRLTAEKVLLDQSMLASESGSPSKKGDPVSWCCRFVAGSGSGRSLRHGVGVRSANCLVDCRRNGGSECPCNWPRFRGHSSYGVSLPTLAPLLRTLPLQEMPRHLHVWLAAGLYNKVSVLIGLGDNTHCMLRSIMTA